MSKIGSAIKIRKGPIVNLLTVYFKFKKTYRAPKRENFFFCFCISSQYFSINPDYKPNPYLYYKVMQKLLQENKINERSIKTFL